MLAPVCVCNLVLPSLPKETVELLQAKVSTLDLAALDQVEARLQVFLRGGRDLSIDGKSPLCLHCLSHLLCLQSVLGKVNEIAKHKAAVEDADTQSKVRATPLPHHVISL